MDTINFDSLYFFLLFSLFILSDLANEHDEAFRDAVSQIKPTTVPLSYLWVLNNKSEVTLNVLPLHVRLLHFSFYFALVTISDRFVDIRLLLYVIACIASMSRYTFRIRGPSICSFAVCAFWGTSHTESIFLLFRSIFFALLARDSAALMLNLSSTFEQNY